MTLLKIVNSEQENTHNYAENLTKLILESSMGMLKLDEDSASSDLHDSSVHNNSQQLSSNLTSTPKASRNVKNDTVALDNDVLDITAEQSLCMETDDSIIDSTSIIDSAILESSACQGDLDGSALDASNTAAPDVEALNHDTSEDDKMKQHLYKLIDEVKKEDLLYCFNQNVLSDGKVSDKFQQLKFLCKIPTFVSFI